MPEAAKADPPIAVGLTVGFDLREALHQAGDRDPPFHARHVHAGAGMVAVAKGDMTIRLAADIEAIGFGKLGRIAIGRADSQRDDVRLYDRTTDAGNAA